jgi:hypothetical protein
LRRRAEQHWKEAVESFGQGLTYHRMVGNEEGLAVTYSQMGQCFLEQGDLENAERCLNNGSDITLSLGPRPERRPFCACWPISIAAAETVFPPFDASSELS